MALPSSFTSDSYEIQFATNYLAHALLIHKILSNLLSITYEPFLGCAHHIPYSRGLPQRISECYLLLNPQGPPKHRPNGVLATPRAEQAGEYPLRLRARPTIYRDLHCEVVSGLGKYGTVDAVANNKEGARLYWNTGAPKEPRECIHTQIWAAVGSGEDVKSGAYYESVGVLGKVTKESESTELAEKLWEWTEREFNAFEVNSSILVMQ